MDALCTSDYLISPTHGTIFFPLLEEIRARFILFSHSYDIRQSRAPKIFHEFFKFSKSNKTYLVGTEETTTNCDAANIHRFY